MAKIVIYGAGVVGRLARHYFKTDSPHEAVAFAVDPGFRQVEELEGLPVLERDEAFARFPPSEHSMFVALSYAKMNRIRAQRYDEAKSAGYSLVSYVSSRCTFLSDHQPGDNCFILEDNTIQPFVKIGNNVTLWSGNHIGHDVVIDDHVFVTSHVVLSGFVHVKSYSFIGVNSTLRDSIVVAEQTLIGAGSVIMKNTKAKGVYMPARAELFAKDSDHVDI
jgi:sugar O-acyltransferase (sialic acid O-acetyltransferase NeuD family)